MGQQGEASGLALVPEGEDWLIHDAYTSASQDLPVTLWLHHLY